MRRSNERIRQDRDRILSELTRDWESTNEIADRLARLRSQVFRDLKWLEDQDLVESRLVPGGPFYCLDDKVILTQENHTSHQGHDVRPVNPPAREWRLV